MFSFGEKKKKSLEEQLKDANDEIKQLKAHIETMSKDMPHKGFPLPTPNVKPSHFNKSFGDGIEGQVITTEIRKNDYKVSKEQFGTPAVIMPGSRQDLARSVTKREFYNAFRD